MSDGKQVVVGGDNPYEKRTPEMDSHNSKVMEHIESIVSAQKALAEFRASLEKTKG